MFVYFSVLWTKKKNEKKLIDTTENDNNRMEYFNKNEKSLRFTIYQQWIFNDFYEWNLTGKMI